jgi:hypothetical protein
MTRLIKLVNKHKMAEAQMTIAKKQASVRNHDSVGMKRPYLHKLSFDHLHYGVA